jgi:hypothetical protein
MAGIVQDLWPKRLRLAAHYRFSMLADFLWAKRRVEATHDHGNAAFAIV